MSDLPNFAPKSFFRRTGVRLLLVAAGLLMAAVTFCRAEWVPIDKNNDIVVQVDFVKRQTQNGAAVIPAGEELQMKVSLRNEGSKTIKVWGIQSVLYSDGYDCNGAKVAAGARLPGLSASPEYETRLQPSQVYSFSVSYDAAGCLAKGNVRGFLSFIDPMDRPLNGMFTWPVHFLTK